MSACAAGESHVLDGIRFRAETAADLPFLQALYANTREVELAGSGWPLAQQVDFLQMQFGLQRRYYREQFPDAAFELIEHAGRAIGRRYLRRRSRLIQLIDLALVPAWRGKGLGGALVHALLAEAAADGSTVELHVEHDNPARRLYERAGFEAVASNGVYLKLQARP